MSFLPRLAALLLFCGAIAVSMRTAQAQNSGVSRTQTIALKKGWNAVWLEVYPENAAPSAVFAGTPVDTVASYFERSSSAQFITNPGAEMFKRTGWGVWYEESRPDAFLKTLHAIHGQQGYLIHSKSETILSISGTATPQEVRWHAGLYNFVGFSVHPTAAPTFAQFFSGSKAHRHNKIYRLVNNAWQRVTDPAAENMRSGEAFWILCDGASKYQGPLRVETTTRSGLYVGGSADSLVLHNHTSNPITSQIEHIVPANKLMPLAVVMKVVGDTNSPLRTASAALPTAGWTQPVPPIEPGDAIRLPFELRSVAGGNLADGSLLKITTDLGTEVWIPVAGARPAAQ